MGKVIIGDVVRVVGVFVKMVFWVINNESGVKDVIC